jgi:hypothetical protein
LGGGNLLYRPSRSLTAYGRFPPIADIGARCDASAMTYQCCYCDQNIDRSKRGHPHQSFGLMGRKSFRAERVCSLRMRSERVRSQS